MTKFEELLECILEEYAKRDSKGELNTWEDTDAFVKKKAEMLLACVNIEETPNENLEEASKKWIRPQLDKSYIEYGEAKQMELTRFDGYAMLDAIEFGANWQKDKMMSDSIDGVITNVDSGFGYSVAAFKFDDNHTFQVLLPVNKNNKYGDKIKLIVSKE